MYNDKEVIAIIKSYNKYSGDMSPESFLNSIDKEEGWDDGDKQASVFKGSIDDGVKDGYMITMEMTFNIPSETIGDSASDEEIRNEFKRLNSWVMSGLESDEQIMIIKNGDMRNHAYASVESAKEKSPKIKDHSHKEKEEFDRYEVLIKKIRYDDDTWSVITYEVNNGQLNKGINIPYCIDAILSSLAAVIRSSGDLQGKYMKKSMEALNILYLDSSIKEQTYKTKKE